jgi:hypothetical protein
MIALIHGAGFNAAQRTTTYKLVRTFQKKKDII